MRALPAACTGPHTRRACGTSALRRATLLCVPRLKASLPQYPCHSVPATLPPPCCRGTVPLLDPSGCLPAWCHRRVLACLPGGR